MTTPAKVQVITRPIRPRPIVRTSKTPVATAPDDGKPKLQIAHQPLDALRLPKRRVRKPGKGQVEAAVATIERLRFVPPFLITSDGEVIDRPEFFEACQRLELEALPTIVVDGLTRGEIKALRLALHKIPDRSVWDWEAVRAELEDLFSIDPDLLAFTGFSMPEIDVIVSPAALGLADAADEVLNPKGPAVSRLGDVWTFADGSKLMCGSAREAASYERLLGGEQVQMVLTDPPYGCRVKGHASRSHREFVEGSGLSEAEALAFFRSFLEAMTPRLSDGAIVDMFIDAPGMFPLMQAIRQAGLSQKALITWDKGAGAMGSLYRQQAEYVLITKWGTAPHINNIELGKHGRTRTTVWSAPGLAQFGKGRKEALSLHPTIKPVGLLFEALLDTSHRGGIVLDPFAGSGSTLLAAHRAQRVGRAVEIDPLYVDVAVTRMQKITGGPARHAETGLSFDQTADERRGSASGEEDAVAGLAQALDVGA